MVKLTYDLFSITSKPEDISEREWNIMQDELYYEEDYYREHPQNAFITKLEAVFIQLEFSHFNIEVEYEGY
jgi:hypothetical protein